MCLAVDNALYGDRGAAGLWHECLDAGLIDYGFRRSAGDPCLYVHDTSGICLLTYVDDTLIKSPATPAGRLALADLNAYLQRRFRYTNKGPATEFTGISITRPDPHTITLSMPAYADSVVSKHGQADARPLLTPAAPHTILSEADCPSTDADKAAMAELPYRGGNGTAAFAACGVP